jgi:hypothetical protein
MFRILPKEEGCRRIVPSGSNGGHNEAERNRCQQAAAWLAWLRGSNEAGDKENKLEKTPNCACGEKFVAFTGRDHLIGMVARRAVETAGFAFSSQASDGRRPLSADWKFEAQTLTIHLSPRPQERRKRNAVRDCR